jgi:hypothetical protein
MFMPDATATSIAATMANGRSTPRMDGNRFSGRLAKIRKSAFQPTIRKRHNVSRTAPKIDLFPDALSSNAKFVNEHPSIFHLTEQGGSSAIRTNWAAATDAFRKAAEVSRTSIAAAQGAVASRAVAGAGAVAFMAAVVVGEVHFMVAVVAVVAGAVAAAVGGDRGDSRCNLFFLSAQGICPMSRRPTHEHVVPSTSSGGGAYHGTALGLAREDHQQRQTANAHINGHGAPAQGPAQASRHADTFAFAQVSGLRGLFSWTAFAFASF